MGKKQPHCGLGSNAGGAGEFSSSVDRVELIELTFQLPDTGLTLSGSCIWSVDPGYQANYIVTLWQIMHP